jgi:integrase/recombinase XerC/integrase/recombinase XerD
MGKLLWFLNDKEIAACDELALKQFFHYLNHGHKDKGGRWGNPKEREPTKPGTAKTYYSIFRAFFNFMISEGEIDESPLSRVPVPIDRPDQMQPFSTEQMQAMLQGATHTTNAKRDKAILYMLLDCALRAGELLALTIGDVDFSRCQVTVQNGKGGKARYIPFSGETRRVLYDYLRDRGEVADEESLFLSDRGRSAGATLTQQGLRMVVKRIGDRMGITGVRLSPHTIRHTFSVEFLRNGGNQFTLMNLLGHTSLTMTSNYVKLAQADVEKQHQQYSPVANMKRKKGTKGR